MRPVVTEKAVMMIESANVLTFEVDKRKSKDKVKQEIEEMFSVKVSKVRSLIKGNKKYVYVKLKQDFPAMDIATKLGLM
ncbi:MAG: 50S ribosomal protein L23 [Nanoarchaeota archaeon]